MRSLRLAILPLLVATSLAAQAPEPSNSQATPVAIVEPRRTAFFDLAALVNSRERFGLEPLGTRLRSREPVFVHVGGWFKIVGVDDPTQQIRPGHLDARLVAAIGVGW